jgi:hypothetical protein
MGVVYLGRDHSLNRDVALKILPEIGNDQQAQAGLDRFYVEAKAVAALRHPNIIVIYELGHEGKSPFIAMEYLPGASLAEVIRDRRPYSDADKARMIGDVCLALQHAHDHGIIHRDVKPANIHIDNSGSVKLLDFGVAKFADVSHTQSIFTVGTPSYLAPEVITGQGADSRSDLFALGVTLSEWVTFEKPFAADDLARVMWKVVHEEPTPVRQLCPNVSPQLEQVIARALAKEPAKRYQRADEMRADLARIAGAVAVTVVRSVSNEATIVLPRTEPAALPPDAGVEPKRRVVPVIALVGLILLAAMLWFVFKRPSAPVSIATAPAARRPVEVGAKTSAAPHTDGGTPPVERRMPATAAKAPVKSTPPVAPVSVSPQPVVEEDATPEDLAPIGTRVFASLLDELNTSRSHGGDAFRAVLDEPMTVGLQELAPAGTPLTGRIYALGGGSRAFVDIALTGIVLNGRAVPIRTTVYRVVGPPASGPSLTALIVGAVAGAGLGAAVGGKSGAVTGVAAGAAIGAQTTVPGSAYISGAHMAFKLAEPIPATVSR